MNCIQLGKVGCGARYGLENFLGARKWVHWPFDESVQVRVICHQSHPYVVRFRTKNAWLRQSVVLDTDVMTPFSMRSSAITLSASVSYRSGTRWADITFFGSALGLRFILILSPFICLGFRSSLMVPENF